MKSYLHEEDMTQPKSCMQSQVSWCEAWHAKEVNSLKKPLIICIELHSNISDLCHRRTKIPVIVPLVMLSATITPVIQTKQLTGEDSRAIVTPVFRFPLKGNQSVGADTYLMTRTMMFT